MGFKTVTHTSNHVPTLIGDGSTYTVYDKYNIRKYSSTSFKSAYDELLSHLTTARLTNLNDEELAIKGYCILDDTCLIPSYTALRIDAKIKAVNSLNKDLFRNQDQTAHNERIRLYGNGEVNGNYSNQSAGWCFNFKNVESISSLTARTLIDQIQVRDGRTGCISINNAGSSQASYFWLGAGLLVEGGDIGVNVINSYDVHIDAKHIGGNVHGIYAEACSSIHMRGGYYNQGITLKDCTYGTISDFRVDIGIARHGIHLQGAQLFGIGNGNINTYNSLGAGKSAIYME